MSNPYNSGGGAYPTGPPSNIIGGAYAGSPGQQPISGSRGLGSSPLPNIGGTSGLQSPQMQMQLPPSSNTPKNPLTAPPPEPSQPPQSSRDINTASLCRIGQETVQDIISRTQEIFQTLKTLQPPNGCAPGINAANEKKMKILEQLRTMRILFKRLRLIYEKCNDNSQLQGLEYTHIESLIPMKEGYDGKAEERKNSEAYRSACEEQRELIATVENKNKILKEVMDHMRRIVWEINTMLMMRRS